MKKTKKSLLFSGLALMMSALLLAGTTFAWFTDSVTNKGNVITSGNLSIDAVAYDVDTTKDTYTFSGVNNGDAFGFKDEGTNLKGENVDPIISEKLWEPGISDAKLLKVTNNGTLAADVQVKFDVKDGGLMNALWFDFINTENGQFTKRPMSQLAALGDATTITLEKGQSVSFILVYGMNEEAGNEYQGKDFSADVKIIATQATVEKDGFGSDQYDKDADSTQIVYSNSFDSDRGDWSEGTVKDGVLVPAAGAYSWYNNYANKGERLADTWTASVDVHVELDKEGKLFEMTNAANKADGTHLRDYVVRLQKVGDEYKVLMSNNANQDLYSDDYATQNAVGTISASGWYTMKWEYSFVDGALSCTMSLVNRGTGDVVATKTLSSATDTDDIVGFNHYLWVYQVNDFVAFEMDNQTLCYE